MVDFVNNTPPDLLLGDNQFRDDTFTAAGADTFQKGMVLARNSSTSKLVPYVSGGGTGIGTPVAFLVEELITAGSGDTLIRPCFAGRAREAQVTDFNAGTPGALTVLEVDLLAAVGIFLHKDNELLAFDNSP